MAAKTVPRKTILGDLGIMNSGIHYMDCLFVKVFCCLANDF